ncbi:M56 family metallopeptidase [Aquimarina algiphila]|uniref:M56 family metallopeptidase n=1 Tax=Aquimarina algiphila TaxID=2047982 RepID=UPI002331188D|nr:M56 family metallopeptidase [Aquimarina algiphila]
MNYIIHSSALIGLSYLIYRFFLSKETFYHLNRWVLLSLIILSFTLPFITVPEHLSFKSASFDEVVTTPPHSVAPNYETLEEEHVITKKAAHLSASESTTNKAAFNTSLDWQSIVLYIYILGILVFGIHFIIQLGVLLYRMIKYPTVEVDDYKIIETDKKHAPYSFWNRIFMNPSQYNPDTYLQILKHEQVHIKGKHSLDMLLVELLVMLQWFNPFAWLYRKAIDNNLEYLTDNNMLNIGEDREVYQMNLLKVSTPNMPTGLATSYNQSFLKKRILMMNSKKSTTKSGWKYLIIIPLLAITVFSFNPIQPKETIISDTKPEIDLNIQNQIQTKIQIQTKNDFTKGVWDAEVGGGKLCIMFRSAEPLKRSFWSTTRCYEPSFFANFPKGDKQKLVITREAGTLTFIGEFENGLGDGRYIFVPDMTFNKALKQYGLQADESDMVHCFFTDFDTTYLTYLKKEKLNISQDDFEDIIHKSLPLDKLKMYRKELEKLGYQSYTMEEISKLNLFNVDIPYINFINKVAGNMTSLKQITKAKIHNLSPEFINSYQKKGINSLSLSEYMKLSIHRVTPEFIDSFKEAGYSQISVREAQNLKIHNVTPKYIQKYKNAGYKNITLKEAQNLKIHNVTPELIDSYKKLGYPNITLQEAKKLKIHNVTPELIKAYKKSGQPNISLQEVVKLKIHNVTPAQAKVASNYSKSKNKDKDKKSSSTNSMGYGSSDQQDPNDFMKGFIALGYKNISIDDMISLKIHNVTPEFIKRYHDAGYTDIPLEDVVALKIHNVTPEFINSFKKAGYKNISIDDAKALKIHNISPELASEYEKIGYKNIPLDELKSLKIHNVTPEYIQEFKKTEFGNLPLDEIVSFKIHNVTPEFVQSFRDIGFSNISADQAKGLKIHNVTPEFVQSLKEKDKNISLEQATRIKIYF